MLSVFVSIVVFLSACGDTTRHSFTLEGPIMGTFYHIKVIDTDKRLNQEKLQRDITQRLAYLNQQFSTYFDDSGLMQFNAAATNVAVPLSAELFHVLLQGLEVSWLSNGAFDVTVGPLVELWGFGRRESGDVLPSDERIENTLSMVGFQYLELDIARQTGLKKQPIQIDLSAIAKGYAVDQIYSLLASYQAEDYMVEIGGEIRASARNANNTPWRIAIEEPINELSVVHRAISISNMAVATSGDYRNYFEKEGVRYSHTISPVSGRPITHRLASVTVIHEEASMADALATAIDVMGPEEGLTFANQQQIAAYMLVKNENGFEARYSDAFSPFIE